MGGEAGYDVLTLEDLRYTTLETFLLANEAGKARITNDLNTFAAGCVWKWQGDSVHRTITNRDALIDYWAQKGLKGDDLAWQIAATEQNHTIDYSPLAFRLPQYKKAFNSLFPNHALEKVHVTVGYHPYMQANAYVLDDGTKVATLSANFSDYRRWAGIKNLFEHYFPMSAFLVPEDQNVSITISKENLSTARLLAAGLRTTARNAMGSPISVRDTEVALMMARLLDSLSETVQQKLEELDRSFWYAGELFALFHEYGHIELGHCQEIQSWAIDSTKDAVELSRRRKRRREMELEADSWGFVHSSIVAAAMLGRSYIATSKSIPEAYQWTERDPRRWQDFLVPPIEVFMMAAFAEEAEQNPELSSYPTLRERVCHLLTKRTELPVEYEPHLLRYFDLFMQFGNDYETSAPGFLTPDEML